MSAENSNTTSQRSRVPETSTPTLETERLILRPLRLTDAQAAFDRWTSDEDVARFMTWSVHKNIDDTLAWLRYEEESEHNAPDNFGFGFVTKKDQQLIGSGGIFYDEGLDRYGIGYCLMKSCWGKGFATEGARCFLNYAIHSLGITRFFAYHATDNPASGTIIEKLGFSYVKDGTYVSADGSRSFSRKEYFLDL